MWKRIQTKLNKYLKLCIVRIHRNIIRIDAIHIGYLPWHISRLLRLCRLFHPTFAYTHQHIEHTNKIIQLDWKTKKQLHTVFHLLYVILSKTSLFLFIIFRLSFLYSVFVFSSIHIPIIPFQTCACRLHYNIHYVLLLHSNISNHLLSTIPFRFYNNCIPQIQSTHSDTHILVFFCFCFLQLKTFYNFFFHTCVWCFCSLVLDYQKKIGNIWFVYFYHFSMVYGDRTLLRKIIESYLFSRVFSLSSKGIDFSLLQYFSRSSIVFHIIEQIRANSTNFNLFIKWIHILH